MGKRVESPNRRWGGYVIISEPLTIPQTIAFEDAVSNARENAVVRGEIESVVIDGGEEIKRLRSISEHYKYDLLSGIIPCVEEWGLRNFPENVTVDTFPGSPKIESANLIAWLIAEITNVYVGNDIPNV